MDSGLYRNYNLRQQVALLGLAGTASQLVQQGGRENRILQGASRPAAVRPGWAGLNGPGPKAGENDRKGLQFICKY